MCLSAFVLTADPSPLGRLDYASLSQQSLMEMMIHNVTNKEVVCGTSGGTNDIKEWRGLNFNENQEVIEIQWTFGGLKGAIHLEWIPSTVHSLWMHGNIHLKGSVDCSKLPRALTKLRLVHNLFIGALDLTALPPQMTEIHVHNQPHNGTLDLTSLPNTISLIDLYNCDFDGTVNLTKLPDSLRRLVLQKQHLSGTVDLTNLPRELDHLCLAENEFSGKTDFSKLHKDLYTLDISDTKLSGTVLVEGEYGDIETSGSDVHVYLRVQLSMRDDDGVIMLDRGSRHDTPMYLNRDMVDKIAEMS